MVDLESPFVLPMVLDVEGDFTNWAEKWESDPLVVVYDRFSHGSGFNALEEKAIIIDVNNNLVSVTVADGTLGTEHANWAVGTGTTKMSDKSVFGRYLALIDGNERYLRIFKDGELIKTIERDAVLDELYGVVISPSGKYIIIMVWDDSGSDYRLRCYEGT